MHRVLRVGGQFVTYCVNRQVKDALGLESHQPAREIEVIDHARSTNGGPLDTGAITRLFERIIDEARRLERLAAKEHER